MQFLMLVWNDPTADAYVPADDNIETWVKENDAAGRRREGDRLQGAEDGRTVRVRSGKLLVTEGPFVETQEQIAGFDLLDCADLDEAVEGRRRPPDGDGSARSRSVRSGSGRTEPERSGGWGRASAPARSGAQAQSDQQAGRLSRVRGARVVAWAPRPAALARLAPVAAQSGVRTSRRTP